MYLNLSSASELAFHNSHQIKAFNFKIVIDHCNFQLDAVIVTSFHSLDCYQSYLAGIFTLLLSPSLATPSMLRLPAFFLRHLWREQSKSYMNLCIFKDCL